MEMQTLPSSYTKGEQSKEWTLLGCHILDKNFITGGLFGKSEGKDNSALNRPPSLRMNRMSVKQLIGTGRTLHDHLPVEKIAIVLQAH